ncbi:hypothetical protein [Streptomyces sp. NPDC004658]|uniref:hypothetical protein n=1 Tax=Streptomyces sp. NPDC004658 TaxID=3154672 RepID=UPI0033A75275
MDRGSDAVAAASGHPDQAWGVRPGDGVHTDARAGAETGVQDADRLRKLPFRQVAG